MTSVPPGDATVHVLVPESIDDISRPSGGNVYDRRLCEELGAAGWNVHEQHVSGRWPNPTRSDRATFAAQLAALPDGALIVVDGLVASASEALAAEAHRLRLAVLVHMPLAEAQPDARTRRVERAVLASADAVVTTSHWARGWMIAHHGLAPERVHVARPGADPGPRVQGSLTGGHLLCVGPVTPDKGHDILMEALAHVTDLEWRCVCVGALDLDRAFVDQLTVTARRAGIADRVAWRGPMSGTDLEAVRSETDLVVSASRRESYGMAVAEGLARGIPAVVTSVGGHPEVLAGASGGSSPGMAIPVGDVGRLTAALRLWLTDPGTRQRLRRAAARRRPGLATWSETASTVSAVLGRMGSVNREPLVPVSPISRHRTDG